ncbi:MAG: hypothetical protein H7Z11_09170 [Verrucomicrobia bacterium]|nr:hypothetical protein [Leptolyngbya sp. ES-bin-22]
MRRRHEGDLPERQFILSHQAALLSSVLTASGAIDYPIAPLIATVH